MAIEPNDVRRTTLRRLRQELVTDVELANNLLHKLNRYMEQLRTCAPELLRVDALPDDPLIKYGFSALEMASFSDMTNSNNLTEIVSITCWKLKENILLDDERHYLSPQYREPEFDFMTRSRSWSFIERPDLLLLAAFLAAQLGTFVNPFKIHSYLSCNGVPLGGIRWKPTMKKISKCYLRSTPLYEMSLSNTKSRSMEEEEVPLVDGVFEDALGALEALEMEAQVDAIVVYSG
ncbi:hypothetical protein Tco_0307567 [Tanacetum coccineum]